jgi:exodeoxyribonuclease VII small subunit
MHKSNKLNFEESLSRLTEISTAMNDSNLPLEESLKLYGEAVGLIDICKRRIETAKLEVEKIEADQIEANGDNNEAK